MNAPSTHPPTWYWWAAGLATLWMLVGVMMLVMDLMTDEAALAAFTEAQRTLYESRPNWLIGVYFVATVGGLLGAIALLRRHRSAVAWLAVSLVAVVCQFAYTTFVLDALTLLGPAQALGMSLVIVAMGALALWFAMHARAKGWLT